MPLRVFQLLLLLLFSLPFAVPFLYAPNPVFPSELTAFGLCALLVLAALTLPRGPRAPLPWMIWPWLGLAALIALQGLLLPTPYLALRLIPILYLVAGALTVLALARARDAYGWAPLLEALVWGLLVGALANSLLAVPQVLGKLQSGRGQVFGNIGQANMYGHYLAWGLAALAWLCARRGIPRALFWCAGPWLAISLAWCGSRSVLMYASAWLCLGVLMLWRQREPQVARFGRWLLLAAVAVLAAQVLTPLINDLLALVLGQPHAVPSALERLSANGARRLVEWQKAWITFTLHPWFGAGWSNYPAYSVALHGTPAFAGAMESKLFTHSHNSLMNLLAETGVLGTAIVLGGLGWAAAGLRRRRHDSGAWLGAALVAVTLLHSMVEYPLWYFHFLAPFILLVFVAHDDAPRRQVPDMAARGLAVIGGALLLALTMVGLQTYRQLHPMMQPAQTASENLDRLNRLEVLRRHPLADFYAGFALSNYVVVNQNDIAWKLGVLDPLVQVRPYPAQLGKAAVLHALRGEHEPARRLIRQAAYAYPANLDWFAEMPQPYAERHPAVRSLLAEVEAAEGFFRQVQAARAAHR
ncbi:Wzy polymerase domain-containing protein [Chitiniphilus purpureus]|uniref:Wzy polymerase domain-containing protein n=1 Tax=Chitiniphilus purpureus TaxID=2981137 RepID=A0ABY6DMG7_9NEIS|nr:Wzy polymerase domain-containing protein [Chitiniphilus sp. CD1]UXY15197.1 Wzy polymerase domain-containing protein [Chitiniphilus sp. CD1]